VCHLLVWRVYNQAFGRYRAPEGCVDRKLTITVPYQVLFVVCFAIVIPLTLFVEKLELLHAMAADPVYQP